MQQFKRSQVIMLPTKVFSEMRIGYYQNILNLNNNEYDKSLELFKTTNGIDVPNPQHLHIISDDEIKEGDWCLLDHNVAQSSGYSILKCIDSNIKNGEYLFQDNNNKFTTGRCKKIIATTDTSLRIYSPCIQCDGTGETTYSGTYNTQKKCDLCSQLKYPNTKAVAQPSQQFIEKYIESYNKGEVITNVLVEYENYTKGNLYGNPMMIKSEVINKLKVNSKDNTITIKKLKNSWNRDEVSDIILKLKKDIITSHYTQIVNMNINDWIEENL